MPLNEKQNQTKPCDKDPLYEAVHLRTDVQKPFGFP